MLRQEMSIMTAALRAADLAPSGWLEPGDLAVILRSAYDPAVAGALGAFILVGRGGHGGNRQLDRPGGAPESS